MTKTDPCVHEIVTAVNNSFLLLPVNVKLFRAAEWLCSACSMPACAEASLEGNGERETDRPLVSATLVRVTRVP
jgi:hypothetical protein